MLDSQSVKDIYTQVYGSLNTEFVEQLTLLIKSNGIVSFFITKDILKDVLAQARGSEVPFDPSSRKSPSMVFETLKEQANVLVNDNFAQLFQL